MSDIPFMFLMMMVVFAVPLFFALWRNWSARRLRAIALPYGDSQALIYQVTESLSRIRFKRGAGDGNQVVFEAGGLQAKLGVAPLTVQFPVPGTARAIGESQSVSCLKRTFPNALDEVNFGPH